RAGLLLTSSMSMMTSRPLLVDHCGQLLTLHGPPRPRRGPEMGRLGIIRNGAVLIQDGQIQAVGPRAEVVRRAAAIRARRLDAEGRVVMPGFVDPHTHALFAGSRVDDYEARVRGATYAGLARGGGGIQASAKRLRAATEASLGTHLREVLPRFLEHGTTTVEIKSGYGLEPEPELKMLRVIRDVRRRSPLDLVPTLLIHDVPARFRATRRSYLLLVMHHLIPLVARGRLAECFDVFCDRGYWSVKETEALLETARRAGLKLKLHAEQLARTGAARLAARVGALSADHLDQLGAGDIPRLARAGTIATLLPGSVLHLASTPYPPARALIDGGVPVALATNFNPGSSPTTNMQLILSLACTQMRMSPAEAVSAATINAAHAVDRGRSLGSLERGKQADLVIMDVADYREIPYYFGMNHCLTVVKRGRIVYRRKT
ncbi:MAG: imidazolonepropionase, partial [Nitrospirales bacterium]